MHIRCVCNGLKNDFQMISVNQDSLCALHNDITLRFYPNFSANEEFIEVPLPAVVSVSPSIGEPRIPGMREILAAGKKPSTVEDLAGALDTKVEIEEIKAPELAPRKQQIFEEGDIDAFAAAVAEALK